MKYNSVPKQAKVRRIPVHLMESVETELEKRQAQGIIQTVEATEWLAPLVITCKSSGGDRQIGERRVGKECRL